MSNESFRPQGNSSLVAVSSSTGAAATQITTGSIVATYVANPSTVSVYVAFGSSLVAAACPTTSIPAAGLCMPSGTRRVFNMGPNPTNSWVSAVTSAGSAQIFVTPGSGQ